MSFCFWPYGPYMIVMTEPIGDRTYRIASYNVRKARGLDGRRDPDRILDVINRLDADVVTLQEADHRLGRRPAALPKDLIAQETDFDVVPLATNDCSIGWHGNAILIRRGIAFGQAERIALPGLEPRGAVVVSLDDGLTIIGVHLGLLRSSRRKQLKVIAAHAPNPKRTVLVGDMNEWNQARGFEALQGSFALHCPGRSFHAARPIAALDRLALTHDLTLVDAGVEQGALARKASDHLPVWADVT